MGSHTIPGAPIPHGAPEHTDVTRELWLPANEGYVKAGTPAFQGYYSIVWGGANLDEPDVCFTIKVPPDFVSFTSVKALWSVDAAAGNMYWGFYVYYGAGGESRSAHSDFPGLGVTANGGLFIQNVQEPANPLTLANLAIGDYLGIRFYRKGSDALDTLDIAAYLYGLLFTYVANQ